MKNAQTEWLRCKPWIESAIDRGPGLETIEDIEGKIELGVYQFWAGKDAAAITDIQTHSGSKAISILYGGGDMASLIKDLLPMVEAAGESIGCDTSMILGRRGWERALKSEGYEHGATILVKKLSGARTVN